MLKCKFRNYIGLLFLLFFFIEKLPGQTAGLVFQDLDSLKVQLSQTSNYSERVELSALIAELYSIESMSDSMQHYVTSAVNALHEIEAREDKEEAYLTIIEVTIQMNLDSFARVALGYIKNPERRARIFLELDEYLYATTDYTQPKCLATMDSVLFYLDQLTLKEELLAEYYYKKSYCYLNTSELLEGLKLLTKAEKILKDDYKNATEIYNILAFVYQQLKDYDKAIEVANKGKKLAEKKQDYFLQSNAQIMIAEAAYSLKKYEMVRATCEEFMDLNKKIGGTGEIIINNILGRTALAENKLDLATDYFNKGLEETDPPPFFLSGSHEGLGEIWYLKNDLEKAKFHADQALELYTDEFDPGLSDRNRGFAKIYASHNDFKRAYDLVKDQLDQKIKSDSLNNPYEVVSTLLNDNFEQEKFLLENQINYQQQLGRQNLVISLGAVIIAFLTFLFFFIRKRNNSRNQMLKQLVKEQTKEILEQKDKLEALDHAKSRLYTNITHEFRTPLAVISGIAHQMEGEEDSKLLIQRNSNQLLNLVNQMLDLRKLESGMISIQKKQGDFIKMIRYLTESLKSYAEMKDLSIHFLSDQKSLMMDFDVEKITRIHSNLLSNAIKFTPEGGDVYVQILTEQNGENGKAIWKVKDTGIGISEEKLPQIFERFYQIDDSSTRQGEGTGIGLTLVAELIKAMDGSIEVYSSLGEGTTFTITLPITNIAALEENTGFENISTTGIIDITPSSTILSKYLENDDIPTEKPSILIVEDNADVIHYLITCLKDNYTVTIAMNGQEGIEKAIEDTPDLIVSDVMMPIKDGFELCQTLKTDERTSHIPIILLTAKADIESRLEGLQRGADAYLSKPFLQEELFVILQNQLELRKKIQARFASFSDQALSKESLDLLQEEMVEIVLEVEDAFLQKIRAIIEKDLSDNEIGMPELTLRLGMSRSQVYKKVKALTGISPSRYIRSIRLNHAHQLLKTSNLNVSEVAYEVGFSSPIYFSNVYLEEFGIRPNETRK